MFRLLSGSDRRPGPRIAIAYNEEYHEYFLEHGKVPGTMAYSNTGVFLIKPGENYPKVYSLLLSLIFI